MLADGITSTNNPLISIIFKYAAMRRCVEITHVESTFYKLVLLLKVTIMLFSFSGEEQRIRSQQRDEVMNEINAYNRRFSGEPRQVRKFFVRLWIHETEIVICLLKVRPFTQSVSVRFSNNASANAKIGVAPIHFAASALLLLMLRVKSLN